MHVIKYIYSQQSTHSYCVTYVHTYIHTYRYVCTYVRLRIYGHISKPLLIECVKDIRKYYLHSICGRNSTHRAEKFLPSHLSRQPVFLSHMIRLVFQIYIYIRTYIYIYMCVCVCVCVWYEQRYCVYGCSLMVNLSMGKYPTC